MEMLSKYSLYLDLKSYTCIDCKQEKPKQEFFKPSGQHDSILHQKKCDRCSDCRKSYTKRYYVNKLKVKSIRTRAIDALDTIVSKIKTPTTSKRYLIRIMLNALFTQLTEDDVEIFRQECMTKVEAVQHRNSNHGSDSDYATD